MSFLKKKTARETTRTTTDYCNALFNNPSNNELDIAKRMAYDCLIFNEKISKSDIFTSYTLMQSCISIAFAKTYYYHIITNSPLAHNLFYGHVQQLYANRYNEDLNDTSMRNKLIMDKEILFLTSYYDYFEESEGVFARVMDKFYGLTKAQTDANGKKLLNVDEQTFNQTVGPLLEDILYRYTNNI